MKERITRSSLYHQTLGLIAQRSTCPRRHVAALAIRDNRIIVTGYNGAPAGVPHCTDAGCVLELDGGCTRATHAEANLIAYSARHGIALAGTDLWVTATPCLACAKLIINAGIRSVTALEKYRVADGENLLVSVNIPVRIY